MEDNEVSRRKTDKIRMFGFVVLIKNHSMSLKGRSGAVRVLLGLRGLLKNGYLNYQNQKPTKIENFSNFASLIKAPKANYMSLHINIIQHIKSDNPYGQYRTNMPFNLDKN